MSSGDASMYSGDTKTLAVVVKDTNNSVVDISSATITWKAARDLHKTADIQKDTSTGISITSGTGGAFSVTINPADTVGLAGDFYHEAEVTFSNGDVQTVLAGTLTIKPDMI